MNFCKFAPLLVLSAATTATPSIAAAGAPGPASRGTVAIRVVIPPHVIVNRLPDDGSGTASRDAGGPCVSASGYRNYHLVLLGPESAMDVFPAASGAADGSACLSAGGLRTGSAAARSGRAAPMPANALTLLIVAD